MHERRPERWSDPETVEGTRRLVDDAVIGDWRRPWNAKPEKSVPDVPPAHFWASDDRGFGQVGCIYTAQGFEYDWSGVIFGDDFVRRQSTWVSRREYSFDTPVKRAAADYPALVRNTYKGAADPRHEGDRGALDRPEDAGVPRGDVPLTT